VTVLKLSDGVNLGLCCKGQRRFCTANGIDFRDFARNGIDVARLGHVEDANMKRAIAAAEAREASDGGR
jgi:hypothetical protein